mgnify:CR=1 FL=1
MSEILESYVAGRWAAGTGEGREVRDAVTGEVVTRVSSEGIDLDWLAYNHVIAPAGLDKTASDVLAKAFHDAVRSDEFAKAAEKLGLIPSGVGPEEGARNLEEKTADAADFLALGK